MAVQFLPHLMSAFALPRKRKPSEICVEICNKREKNIPNIIDLNLNHDH